MDSWILCRVDLYAFFFFFFFFLRCFRLILCYASGFYMLLFFRQMFLTHACVCVCVCVCMLFIGIVQRNWACLTWKSAIEIKSLLLLLLWLWPLTPPRFAFAGLRHAAGQAALWEMPAPPCAQCLVLPHPQQVAPACGEGLSEQGSTSLYAGHCWLRSQDFVCEFWWCLYQD